MLQVLEIVTAFTFVSFKQGAVFDLVPQIFLNARCIHFHLFDSSLICKIQLAFRNTNPNVLHEEETTPSIGSTKQKF